MAEFKEDRAKPPQHSEDYLKTTYACGLRREHVARVHRATWPPREVHAHSTERPSLSARCERCGANLILYNPPPMDVTVILYGDPSEAHGRVEDEVGTVRDDAPPPTAGTLVEGPVAQKAKR